jgi:hypothetical protein
MAIHTHRTSGDSFQIEDKTISGTSFVNPLIHFLTFHA